MDEMKSEKKPMSIRLSASTQERMQKTIESYKNLADDRRDQQENALIRILDIADSDVVRGTHPELEKSLISIDATIATLIKQINGIAIGQDGKIEELQRKLESAITDKQQMQEKVLAESEQSKIKISEAEQAIQKASEEIKIAKDNAAEKIQSMQVVLDQANRERDDARIIADEKAASNNLLLKQMAEMESDIAAYKKLLVQYQNLQDKFNDLTAKSAQDKMQAELALEKAVIAKERELRDSYDNKLRQADKENARLQILLEQLQIAQKKLSPEETS